MPSDMIRNLEHPVGSNICYLNVLLQLIAHTLLKWVINDAVEGSNDSDIKSLKTFLISYDAPQSSDEHAIKTEFVLEVRSMLLEDVHYIFVP